MIKEGEKAPDFSLESSDGKVLARKSFRFTKNSYQSQVATEVGDGGAPVPHLIEWRGGFGDMTVPSPVAAQQCGVVSSRAFRLGLRSRLSVPRHASRSILPSSSSSASAVATNAFVTDIIRWRLHRLAWREDYLSEISQTAGCFHKYLK